MSTALSNAMQLWNARLSLVQLSGLIEAPTPGAYADGGGKNEIFFSADIYGTAFSSTTLAVTTAWSRGNNQRTEADILFHTAITWDSYRGARSSGQAYDIRRVGIHELGHVLGLDHPDEAVPMQTVTAIMNSHISAIDDLQPDDYIGAQNLYGTSGASAPANDNFANATLIVLTTSSATLAGANIYPNAASRESGEPLIVGNPGGHSVWWRWTAPSSGTVTFDTRGSLFDTTMGVYTGSAVNALTLAAPSSQNDDESSTPVHINTSLVSFAAVGGTTYSISVDGFFDASYLFGEVGAITLNVTFAGAIGVAPGITTQPASTSVTAGAGAAFTSAASGTPAPTLQWQRLPFGSGTWANVGEAGSYSGTTTGTLTVTGTTTGMSGDQFRCVATNPSGTATSSAAVLTVSAPPVAVRGDFNGDGKSDVLLTNTATGERVVWLMNGLTISAGSYVGVLATNWVFSGTGDFNGDGKVDIVLTNTATGERVVWLMNGPTITAGAYLGVLSTDWAISGIGDFNADGKADIVLTNTVTGDRAIWIMNGTTIAAGAYLPVLPTTWAISGIGDFNSDGKSDLVLTNTFTGDRAIWLMNGTTIAAGAYLPALATTWVISGIGDFNGDGKSDVVLSNTVTGERAVWLMNGTVISSGAYIGVLATDWTFSQIGDFNGDGKADIFLTNTVTGDRAIWLMNGTAISAGSLLGVIATNWLIRD
jgi:hypothetical protein